MDNKTNSSAVPEEKLIMENLRELKSVFDEFGIKFWLDWGTLLGAVRDGKVLAWDSDADIGLMTDDYEKIVSTFPELKKRGFLIDEMPIPTSETILRKFCFTRFGSLLDTWPYYYEKDEDAMVSFVPCAASGNLISRKLTRGLWILYRLLLSCEMDTDSSPRLVLKWFIKRFLFLMPAKLKNYLTKKVEKILIKKEKGAHIRRIIVPKHYFEKLENIDFYGMTFNVPSQVKEYVKYKYGENWEIPDKGWDWKNDGAVGFLKKTKKI